MGRNGRVTMRQLKFAHDVAEPLSNRQRLVNIGFRQNSHKLFTAITGQQVTRTIDGLMQGRGYLDQTLIAATMPIIVVIGLEKVDIHHKQSQWQAIAGQATGLFSQHPIEVSTIGNLGQAVDV